MADTPIFREIPRGPRTKEETVRRSAIALSLTLFLTSVLAAQDERIVVTIETDLVSAYEQVFAAAVTLGQVITYTDGTRVIAIGSTDRFPEGHMHHRASFTVNLLPTGPEQTTAFFSADLIQAWQSARYGFYWIARTARLQEDSGGDWEGHAVAWLNSWADAVR